MSENRNVPKLRFSGFTENWPVHRFSEIFEEFQSGNGITSKEITETGDYPVYGGNGLRGYANKYTHEGEYLLIGRQGALCGNINLVQGRNYISEHAIAARANSNSSTQWLAARLDFMNLNRLSESSAQPGLSVGKLLRLKLSTPSLPEQQKIAEFLTAVDRRIELFQAKKEKLEAYKKGVMQKIFPSTGSGQAPQLRFKADHGSDFPDWEERKLGEVARIFDGTHQTPKYVEEGVPFYSVEHVTANQFSKTKFISEKVFEKENKRVKLEKGDILMTRIGSIGVPKLIDWDVRASFYVSLALIKISPKVDSGFLTFCISETAFQRELWKRTIHVAFPQKINLGEIGDCSVNLPSLEEQKKIAEFLTSLDSSIENLNQQINQTQTWKKGLLQKMFV